MTAFDVKAVIFEVSYWKVISAESQKYQENKQGKQKYYSNFKRYNEQSNYTGSTEKTNDFLFGWIFVSRFVAHVVFNVKLLPKTKIEYECK